MKFEHLSVAVFWSLAALALTAVAGLVACVVAAVNDVGAAALLAIPIALQLLIDLYCMLVVRQGALEVSHPATLAPRGLLLAALSIETVAYVLGARALLVSPTARWIVGLLFARGGVAGLCWIGVAAALWISRDRPFHQARARREPDQSTGLPDDEMTSDWDQGRKPPKP